MCVSTCVCVRGDKVITDIHTSHHCSAFLSLTKKTKKTEKQTIKVLKTIRHVVTNSALMCKLPIDLTVEKSPRQQRSSAE